MKENFGFLHGNFLFIFPDEKEAFFPHLRYLKESIRIPNALTREQILKKIRNWRNSEKEWEYEKDVKIENSLKSAKFTTTEITKIRNYMKMDAFQSESDFQELDRTRVEILFDFLLQNLTARGKKDIEDQYKCIKELRGAGEEKKYGLIIFDYKKTLGEKKEVKDLVNFLRAPVAIETPEDEKLVTKYSIASLAPGIVEIERDVRFICLFYGNFNRELNNSELLQFMELFALISPSVISGPITWRLRTDIEKLTFLNNCLANFPHINLKYVMGTMADAYRNGDLETGDFLKGLVTDIGLFLDWRAKALTRRIDLEEEPAYSFNIRQEVMNIKAYPQLPGFMPQKSEKYNEKKDIWKRLFNVTVDDELISIILTKPVGPFYTLVQNLILNSLNHGFRKILKTVEPRISIELRKEGNVVCLTYSDNGRGFTEEDKEMVDKWHKGEGIQGQKGFGLQMVAECANYMDWKYKVDWKIKKDDQGKPRWQAIFTFKFNV